MIISREYVRFLKSWNSISIIRVLPYEILWNMQIIVTKRWRLHHQDGRVQCRVTTTVVPREV